MAELRKGCQTPSRSFILPYTSTYGDEAIALYNATGRTAQEWQELIVNDILAYNDDGLWVHTKYGYSVPRRNGKNEIAVMIELYAITHGLKTLHTAHRTTTSSSASKRLVELLDASGFAEIIRPKKGGKYEKAYVYSKLYGLEKVTVLDEGGGSVDFRTRTSKGGLGEGFDLLIIDEAQEYQDDQESSLKYVVSDSQNPQTIFCGTPPTPISSGTVFVKYRRATLAGETANGGWAEWSVDNETDPNDKEAWYKANPSLGTILTERKIADEIGTDRIDFNIQRLGLWLRYNQKSEISQQQWNELQVETVPEFVGKMYAGVKYGHSGENVSLSIALKTKTNSTFVEVVDCRPMSAGNDWIVQFIKSAEPNISKVVVDGANGQSLLFKNLKDAGVKKKPIFPTVHEIINANAAFKSALDAQTICHADQPSLLQVVSNCEKRSIGSNGGFGYRSIKDGADISLLDSVILAHWICSEDSGKAKPIKIIC